MRHTITMVLSALMMMFCLEACAMGGKSIKPRKNQDKMWHLCQDFEMKYHGKTSPVGKVCNNVCLKRKGRSCKSWQRNMMDLTIEKDFLFFRNGAFVLIDEDQLK